MNRDLIGYGGAWPDLIWPNGAKPAVSVVVNVEVDAEQQALDGDPVSKRIGAVLSIVPEGRPDPGLAQIFACGPRAGAWRMAKALRRFRVAATLFACGRAAKRVAPVLRMLVEDGHETACHGWLWRPHADYDIAEAADLDRAAEAILRTTGERPRGFVCRGVESPRTRGLLAERGYLYPTPHEFPRPGIWNRHNYTSKRFHVPMPPVCQRQGCPPLGGRKVFGKRGSANWRTWLPSRSPGSSLRRVRAGPPTASTTICPIAMRRA